MKKALLMFVRSLAVAGGYCLVVLSPAVGQERKPAPDKIASAAAWPQYMPDGQPDVRGFWVAAVYGMGCLSNPRSGPNCVPEEYGRATRQPPPKAASRIIDTADGEVPYQPWAREKQKYLIANYFEPTRPEFLDPQQICLPLGAVRQVTWHDIHLLQYDDYIVFEHEGGHVYQIIPLDGRPHASSKIKLWMGDSRGHWEGTTLVIDVTNNNSKGRLSRSGDFASENVHNTVKIKFLDADHARYEAVFDDPTVYTQPWTFGLDLKRSIFGSANVQADDAHYEQWEEACYEGLTEVDHSLRPGKPVQPATASK